MATSAYSEGYRFFGGDAFPARLADLAVPGRLRAGGFFRAGRSRRAARSRDPILSTRIRAASSMIPESISPAAPPRDGLWERQTPVSSVASARISAKLPWLFTLRGATSAMSIGPAQSSLCLMRSHWRPGASPLRPVLTSTQEPFSL